MKTIFLSLFLNLMVFASSSFSAEAVMEGLETTLEWQRWSRLKAAVEERKSPMGLPLCFVISEARDFIERFSPKLFPIRGLDESSRQERAQEIEGWLKRYKNTYIKHIGKEVFSVKNALGLALDKSEIPIRERSWRRFCKDDQGNSFYEEVRQSPSQYLTLEDEGRLSLHTVYGTKAANISALEVYFIVRLTLKGLVHVLRGDLSGVQEHPDEGVPVSVETAGGAGGAGGKTF